MHSIPKRTFTSLAATGLVLALVGVGTANAAALPVTEVAQAVQTQQAQQVAPPRGKAAATSSPLYKTGRLADSNCSPGDLPRGSTAAYSRFLKAFTNCLNRSWASQFRKARLGFSKPRLRIFTTKRKTPCGGWSRGAAGVYCSADRTMYMLITKTELRNPSPAGIGRLMAHEYAHHVQQISGILPYYAQASWRAGKAAKLQYSRRLELQAECLSSVFMRTIEDTLPVDPTEWGQIVDWFRQNGHKGWAQNDHGKGSSQAFWMERGWSYAAPAACNTWSVGSRYVA